MTFAPTVIWRRDENLSGTPVTFTDEARGFEIYFDIGDEYDGIQYRWGTKGMAVASTWSSGPTRGVRLRRSEQGAYAIRDYYIDAGDLREIWVRHAWTFDLLRAFPYARRDRLNVEFRELRGGEFKFRTAPSALSLYSPRPRTWPWRRGEETPASRTGWG
jgi:hypothetical protein